MAFGKDPTILGQIGNFQQQSTSFQNRGPKRGGGGGHRFRDSYKPSENFVDLIRLIPVDYTIEWANEHGKLCSGQLGYYTFVEHFDGRTQKSTVCSAGPFSQFREKRLPCHGCDCFWAQPRTRGGATQKKRMGKRDMYVFEVLDYDTYYEIEQVDRDSGQMRLKDDGTPWMEWIKGVGRKDLVQAGKNSMEGRLVHWAMGHGHYTTLLATNEMIGEGCKSCGKKNAQDERSPAIKSLAWLCANPECGEALIDCESTEMQVDEIKKAVGKEMFCRRCKHEGLPNEFIECAWCQTPVRATIYDVDLQVRRVKSKDDGNQTTLMIPGWSVPRAIDPKYEEYLKKLHDFPKMYGPSPMDEQYDKFGSVEGFKQAPEGGAIRPYQGGGQGGNSRY